MTGASSSPLVLFENGAISGSYSWAWVAARLPAGVRSLTYDRGARSFFDAAFRRMDYRSTLARLRAQMPEDAAEIVVVGHSIGGLLARAHANAFGNRVVGLVLVDPAPPAQFAAGVDHEFQYLRLNQSLAVRTVRSLVHRRPRVSETVDLVSLPEEARSDALSLLCQPTYWFNSYRESKSAGGDWLGSALFPDVESRPVAVVSSDVSRGQHALQNSFETDILRASANSRRYRVEGASHASILFDKSHSETVNEAIEWVLAAAETGVRS